MTEKPLTIDEFIQIDINSKYIVLITGQIYKMEAERIENALNEWAKNDKPFLIMNNEKVKLVKVYD